MSNLVEPYVTSPVSAEEAIQCLRDLAKQIKKQNRLAYSVSGECSESFVAGVYRHRFTVEWTQEKET